MLKIRIDEDNTVWDKSFNLQEGMPTSFGVLLSHCSHKQFQVVRRPLVGGNGKKSYGKKFNRRIGLLEMGAPSQ